MTDVLHYYFESDLNVSSEDEALAKSESRSLIYKTLYGTTYKYGISKSDRSYNSDGSNLPTDGYYGDDDIQPFDPDPSNNVTKPFVPSSDFNADSPLPFGKILDAPLN